MFGLAACSPGGFSAAGDQVYAPGVNQRAEAQDGIEVGHRLIAAGQYELAIKSFNRAALEHGLDVEVLSGLGSANLGLGRLGQAEKLLRTAIKKDATQPEVWNNLGVVLMERGQTVEAEQILRRAYAMDNGESDAIRDNLRLALAKSENPDSLDVDNDNYKLVRRGSGDYLISSTL
ncbi:tetratricopeptide repeat protein [Sulfitobacter sp. M57]|uniref:tetratricopeptide repeat protein n=1 Tax=unclassified Sulfitobacter TaxID=196795 RepID=UPI0023E2F1FC|nr:MULTISPECIES: tetratricopeptide repeat protein [unclassified Sulfitobacter]MDF3412969.1 tetratricopeptide repeat protein [Sulfitobacter sp. KE5]MDF3421747.1 tetratricopeptide repeat protein [Sulfitobacter sp. KE43]MDF3431518.1 tetratricopeptide repeat protein [Sulfitobacter sp. KE42]MDF3457159.1 tetratricopeptide repeat protein [Sulfitobacter sp. S74]MDF3461062.1 tetratricopeptide repeat protein [Sulfitobacter sp. Ks18]